MRAKNTGKPSVQTSPRPPPPLQCCNKFPQRPPKIGPDSATVTVFVLTLATLLGERGSRMHLYFPLCAIYELILSIRIIFIALDTKTFKSVTMYTNRNEYQVYTGQAHKDQGPRNELKYYALVFYRMVLFSNGELRGYRNGG